MTVTANEVQQVILAAFNEDHVKSGYDPYTRWDSAINEIEWWLEGDEAETPLGRVALETSVGGEGEGETRYLVFKLVHHDDTVRYFRADGYYASWDGSNWDDADLVEVRKVPSSSFDYPTL